MTTPRFNADRHTPQLIPHRLLNDSESHHPAVLDEAKRRSERFHLRLADHVTAFAGFLSTFVMIGQNRQVAFQQAKADHDYEAQELELKANTEMTRQIHSLTEELHRHFIGGSG